MSEARSIFGGTNPANGPAVEADYFAESEGPMANIVAGAAQPAGGMSVYDQVHGGKLVSGGEFRPADWAQLSGRKLVGLVLEGPSAAYVEGADFGFDADHAWFGDQVEASRVVLVLGPTAEAVAEDQAEQEEQDERLEVLQDALDESEGPAGLPPQRPLSVRDEAESVGLSPLGKTVVYGGGGILGLLGIVWIVKKVRKAMKRRRR